MSEQSNPEQSDSLELIAACLALPFVNDRIDALIREGVGWGNNEMADRARKERDAKLGPLQQRAAALRRVIYGGDTRS
jgi:hypothetical protein